MAWPVSALTDCSVDGFLSAAYKALRKLHDLWDGRLKCIGDVHGHIMFFFKPFTFVLTTDCLVQCVKKKKKKMSSRRLERWALKKRKLIASLYLCAFRRFLSSAPLSVNRYLENIHMMLLGSGSRSEWEDQCTVKKKSVASNKSSFSLTNKKIIPVKVAASHSFHAPPGLFRRIPLILGQSSSHFCTCHSS